VHPRINPPAIAFIEVSPDAKSAAIMVGEVMRISVGENTTTGYHWKVVAIGSKILKQLPFVVQPEVNTSSSNPLAGNGSVTTFQFQGVAPGTTDLMLNYAPFYSPKPKDIAEKIRIKVTVTASHV
jgi:predicted secreted protein